MDLKNTWNLRIAQVLYPFGIVPKGFYVGKINFDELLKKQQVYLLRRSLLSFEKTFVENGMGGYELNEDALVDKKRPTGAFNLSTNIFGASFKESFQKYRLLHNAEGGQKWKMNSIRPHKYLQYLFSSVSLNDEGCSIFIDANKIHNRPQKFLREADASEQDKFLEKMGSKPIMVKKQMEYPGSVKVIHDPLNLNYWHAECGFFKYDDERLDRLNGKWGETFCKDVVGNILSLHCYPKPDGDNYYIPKSAYIK
jgi:hypothetical protein